MLLQTLMQVYVFTLWHHWWCHHSEVWGLTWFWFRSEYVHDVCGYWWLCRVPQGRKETREPPKSSTTTETFRRRCRWVVHAAVQTLRNVNLLSGGSRDGEICTALLLPHVFLLLLREVMHLRHMSRIWHLWLFHMIENALGLVALRAFLLTQRFPSCLPCPPPAASRRGLPPSQWR